MISRAQGVVEMPIKIVGSSTFGRYSKISTERTFNMFISDNFMVPYLGYQSITNANGNKIDLGSNGRAIFSSSVLNKMVCVVGNSAYILDVIYNTTLNEYIFNPQKIGTLLSFNTDVYITENNANQIIFSDSSNLYVYNPNSTTPFVTLTANELGFIPGYVTFHNTYFICASLGTNQFRLSDQSDGTVWPDDQVGTLQTKPDNVIAVTAFPSRGNMIFVFGSHVTEAWFDTGAQLFPYQKNTNFNIDYGCISPATIAAYDEYVIWLAKNESSGPIILISSGGMPEKIPDNSDGIDYLLSNLSNPQNSEAFMFRQDGHLFYSINFYTDNITLVYDVKNKKFYNACDEKYNFYIAKQVAYSNNQYYFISRKNGYIYGFSTIYTTYDGELIPRIRICNNVRLPTQEYFIANDIGFTMEQGVSPAQKQSLGIPLFATEDGNLIITNGDFIYILTEEDNYLITENGQTLAFQEDADNEYYLTFENQIYTYINPRVDMSISSDGGETFGNYVSYTLNPNGKSRNMIRWWQLGMSNDFVAKFVFWGLSRFVCTDGILNIRQ